MILITNGSLTKRTDVPILFTSQRSSTLASICASHEASLWRNMHYAISFDSLLARSTFLTRCCATRKYFRSTGLTVDRMSMLTASHYKILQKEVWWCQNSGTFRSRVGPCHILKSSHFCMFAFCWLTPASRNAVLCQPTRRRFQRPLSFLISTISFSSLITTTKWTWLQWMIWRLRSSEELNNPQTD